MSLTLGTNSYICLENDHQIDGNIMNGTFTNSNFNDIIISDFDINNLNLSGNTVNNLSIKDCTLHDIDFVNTSFNNLIIENIEICSSTLNGSSYNTGNIIDWYLIKTTASNLFFSNDVNISMIYYKLISPEISIYSQKNPQLIEKVRPNSNCDIPNINLYKCFHKDTYVQLKNKVKKMKNLSVRDRLDKNQIVKRLHKYKVNKKIYMVLIPKFSLSKISPNRDLFVTPLHYIFINGEYIQAYKCVNINGIKLIKTFIDFLVNLELENKYQSFIANGTFSISDGHTSNKLDYFISCDN